MASSLSPFFLNFYKLGLGIYSAGFSYVIATEKMVTINGIVSSSHDLLFPFEISFFALVGSVLIVTAIADVFNHAKRIEK